MELRSFYRLSGRVYEFLGDPVRVLKSMYMHIELLNSMVKGEIFNLTPALQQKYLARVEQAVLVASADI